jgi:hypothetical protein
VALLYVVSTKRGKQAATALMCFLRPHAVYLLIAYSSATPSASSKPAIDATARLRREVGRAVCGGTEGWVQVTADARRGASALAQRLSRYAATLVVVQRPDVSLAKPSASQVSDRVRGQPRLCSAPRYDHRGDQTDVINADVGARTGYPPHCRHRIPSSRVVLLPVDAARSSSPWLRNRRRSAATGFCSLVEAWALPVEGRVVDVDLEPRAVGHRGPDRVRSS